MKPIQLYLPSTNPQYDITQVIKRSSIYSSFTAFSSFSPLSGARRLSLWCSQGRIWNTADGPLRIIGGRDASRVAAQCGCSTECQYSRSCIYVLKYLHMLFHRFVAVVAQKHEFERTQPVLIVEQRTLFVALV